MDVGLQFCLNKYLQEIAEKKKPVLAFCSLQEAFLARQGQTKILAIL